MNKIRTYTGKVLFLSNFYVSSMKRKALLWRGYYLHQRAECQEEVTDRCDDVEHHEGATGDRSFLHRRPRQPDVIAGGVWRVNQACYSFAQVGSSVLFPSGTF